MARRSGQGPRLTARDASLGRREENTPMNKEQKTIGFVGLGNMGSAMATSLLKAGFGLRVFNRTVEKARPLLEQGATLARSPAEAVEPGGIVVTMLTDDRA